MALGSNPTITLLATSQTSHTPILPSRIDISIYGIDVQQDYLNGGPTGNPSNGVIIENLLFNNVTGIAASGATDYYVLCGTVTSKTGFPFVCGCWNFYLALDQGSLPESNQIWLSVAYSVIYLNW
jgi:Glycosyl hydrolases family 28